MDLRDLVKNLDKQIKTTKKAKCKRCGEDSGGNTYCEKCKEEKAQAKVGRQAKSQEGYIYQYDKNGKLRIAARIIMEELLGRGLLEHEIVMYRDGDRTNLDQSNLVLGWKNGTPLDFFTCAACGARGNVIVSPPKDSTSTSTETKELE